MNRRHATATGFVAVLLWALLALFTVGSAPLPPLQLNAICFAIGGAIGLIWTWRTDGFGILRTISWKVYAFGTIGLFGYHALYFSALRLAPAAEAGLIAYLWPLLIVLFSGLLPGEKLRSGHVLGGIVGFGGAAVLIAKGADLSFGGGTALLGYGFALLCALTWSGYSVLSRKLGNVPTASVAVYCIATAILSVPAHLVFEQTVWPTNALPWLSAIALGLGPVGLAFYVWDVGVKHGDIQMLGVTSYAAPLLSTLVLVITGYAQATPVLFVSAALITGGAALAARASAKGKG